MEFTTFLDRCGQIVVADPLEVVACACRSSEHRLDMCTGRVDLGAGGVDRHGDLIDGLLGLDDAVLGLLEVLGGLVDGLVVGLVDLGQFGFALFELLGGLVELLLGLHDALFGGADASVGLGHRGLSGGDPVVPDLGDLLGANVGVAVLAEEGHEDLPAHVERREQRREQTDDPQHRVDVVGVGQDFVFRPEARERRHAGDCEPADDEGGRGDRHQLLQAAVVAHVLVVMHAMNDGSRTEEQQRLEEGVGDHVEDGGDVGADADSEEHVPELADRRVRQHLLDVVLGDGDGGGEQCRERTHPRDQVGGPRGGLGQHRVDPSEQVDARRHHGGGVDERGDRGRAGHCVGQPQIERELG